jgi:hypothetical protein
VAALLAGGGRWIFLVVGFLLIGCFNFILDWCIFLKIVRCQLINDGQKTPLLHPIRMTAALLLITFSGSTRREDSDHRSGW